MSTYKYEAADIDGSIWQYTHIPSRCESGIWSIRNQPFASARVVELFSSLELSPSKIREISELENEQRYHLQSVLKMIESVKLAEFFEAELVRETNQHRQTIKALHELIKSCTGIGGAPIVPTHDAIIEARKLIPIGYSTTLKIKSAC